MKMQQIFSVLIVVSLALTLTVPVQAAEGKLPAQEPEMVDTVPEDTTQTPEGTTQTSDEAETPDDTQEPGETGIPDDTQNPDEMEAPDDTQNLDETEPTDDTQNPDETEPTDDTQNPDETVIPDDAQNPDDTNLDVEEDHIDMVVPAVGQVILNPYRMPVDTAGGTTNEQVIYQPQELVNYSAFPVVVTAVVTGSLAGDAWIVNAPPAQDALDKEMFLYAEFQNQTDMWAESYSNAPNQLLVNDIAKDVMTLEAGGRGYFRLSGAMTPFPQNMWGDENALSVTISYTFARDPASIPAVPEDPGELEDPRQMEEPGQAEDPRQSEEPGQAEDPGQSEEPGQTEDPGQSEEPGQTEDPGQSEEPEQTEETERQSPGDAW